MLASSAPMSCRMAYAYADELEEFVSAASWLDRIAA